MYRKVKDGSVVRMVKHPLVEGDPIVDITYNSDNLPAQIIYRVISKSGTETIDLTYTQLGYPIFKGITYLGASINIFDATISPLIKTDPSEVLYQRQDDANQKLGDILTEMRKLNTYFALITNTRL